MQFLKDQSKWIILSILLLFGIILKSYSQCPTPEICTFTAVSGTNYTVNAGQTLCIISPTNYSSGSITLNGGTLYIASGATISTDLSTPSTSTINNCGTISGSRNFNSKTIINNYSNNSTITYSAIDNGVIFNNFATGVTLNVNNGNPNSPVNITNASGASIQVVTNPSNTNCSSSLGNSTNITNSGTMTFPNSLCMKSGLITNNSNLTFSNQLAMDGGTIESKAGSNTSIGSLRKNNGNINVYDKSILSINNIINLDNGAIKMMDAGCSYITLATPPSSSFNSNLTDNGSNVSPNGINYCGGVPKNSAASGNTISSVANNGSGLYRITFTNGTNAPNNGDYIDITGVVGGNLNGYWKVIKISNYVYDLTGGVYSPVTNIASNYVYTNNLRFGNATYMAPSECSNPCVPLGVGLLYFTAQKNNGTNIIKWQTTQELNNQYFVVERSSNGINFETISIVDATNGNGSSYIEYDLSPLNGVSYYRLKSIDLSGKYTYSNIVVLNSDLNTNWYIYPNPVIDGKFTIVSDFNQDDVLSVDIIDVRGALAKSYKSIVDEMVVSDLASGMYILTIKTLTNSYSKKIILK